MTVNEYNKNVWMFYLQLENDFYDTLNYVEFSQENFSTYSKEYTKQLLSIGSEIDIVCKLLCEQVNPSAERKCITDYAKILCNHEGLKDARVLYKLTKEIYTPFSGWDERNSPSWWKAYNSVKHDRTTADNYKKGNLENVFSALVGLYVLNRYLCKRIDGGQATTGPEMKSRLFEMDGWTVYTPVGNGFNMVARPNGNVGLSFMPR